MQLVAKKLNLSFHPSVNRAIFSKFSQTQISHETLAAEQRWQIQRASFMAKIQQDAGNLPGIYERSLLDHYMYCLIYCHQVIAASELREMQQVVNNNLAGYDRLYFFPLYLWSSDVQGQDGFRDSKLANRYLQEHILHGFLFDKSYQVVPDLSINQRLMWLLTDINNIEQDAKICLAPPKEQTNV